MISIHAPTRGATSAVYPYRQTKGFQSTLPREERRELEENSKRIIEFQSTLPREERRRAGNKGFMFRNFNPRSHERSDEDEHITPEQAHKFQSTLPREERRAEPATRASCSGISIHAPTRGATGFRMVGTQSKLGFQSTLPREERRSLLPLG